MLVVGGYRRLPEGPMKRMINAVLCLALLLPAVANAGQQDPPAPAAPGNPACKILEPRAGEPVAGDTVRLVVLGSDDREVRDLKVTVNGQAPAGAKPIELGAKPIEL